MLTKGKQMSYNCLPMVNCSYCGEEIDRNVFCKPSHKVMFHREEGTPEKEKRDRLEKKLENFKFCKHGVPSKLCKHKSCSQRGS